MPLGVRKTGTQEILKSDDAIWRRPAREVAAASAVGWGELTSRATYAVAEGRVIALSVSNWGRGCLLAL